jgi:hypothetical protein
MSMIEIKRFFDGTVLATTLLGTALLGGCSTASLVLTAAGVATDTSMTWEIVKHVHGKITEGDDVPCLRLNSVQRALNPRCGAFIQGSLKPQEIQTAKLQECPLAVVVRDPRLWPALPEFLSKGARLQACTRSPWVELAQAQRCPDFSAATPAELNALQSLVVSDARAVHHDVVRLLSCPQARKVGLNAVLSGWQAQGLLARNSLAFGMLGALHPDYLNTPFARTLEEQGHTARDALGGFEGVQPSGFEEALRLSDWAALEWWLSREPGLVNRVPASQNNQLPWLPLARVLMPNFLDHPNSQADTVEFLMARGANPDQKLPYDTSRTVLQHAQAIKSPMVAVLNPKQTPTMVAKTSLPSQSSQSLSNR